MITVFIRRIVLSKSMCVDTFFPVLLYLSLPSTRDHCLGRACTLCFSPQKY